MLFIQFEFVCVPLFLPLCEHNAFWLFYRDIWFEFLFFADYTAYLRTRLVCLIFIFCLLQIYW